MKMEENCGEEKEKIGIFQMLKIPNIFVCICCLLLMSIGWFFYEPSLAIHLGTVIFDLFPIFLFAIFAVFPASFLHRNCLIDGMDDYGNKWNLCLFCPILGFPFRTSFCQMPNFNNANWLHRHIHFTFADGTSPISFPSKVNII